MPAQELRPHLKVANDSRVILWNTDKTYLDDLLFAGFAVPETKFVRDLSAFSTTESLATHISTLAKGITNGPVILKPSVSGSSKQTYRINDPSNMNDADHEYLANVVQDGIDGALMVQEFEPAIANGEYSLVFTAGVHTHTMVKTPAQGEFRCQAEFGGGIRELPMKEVPEVARRTAKDVTRFMESKVGAVTYCKVDGVVRKSGEFVLMEVEAIKPHLWLETCNDSQICEALYAPLLRPNPQSAGFGESSQWLLGSLAGRLGRWIRWFKGYLWSRSKFVKT